MSKERLEEMERKFLNEGFLYNAHSTEPQQLETNIAWIIKYAKEQAERVHELEESIKGHIKVKQVLAKKLHAARKENERYRKVIEKTVLEIHEIDRMNKPIGNPILSNIVARNLYMRSELMKALEGDPYE